MESSAPILGVLAGDGAGDYLHYTLVWNNLEDRVARWLSFRTYPEWISTCAESEATGRSSSICPAHLGDTWHQGDGAAGQRIGWTKGLRLQSAVSGSSPRGRMAKIADTAGYTTGAIYPNYGSKEDLFLAVVE